VQLIGPVSTQQFRVQVTIEGQEPVISELDSTNVE